MLCFIVAQHSWNVTLIIKDARQIADLNSHRLEFVAENRYDTAEHLVVVDAEGTPGQFLGRIVCIA